MSASKLNVLAVIPARGGSKGIPRKNACLLAGKPLVAHAIQCALSARSVNRVAVSTDDPEIAAIARAHSAQAIERPMEISGDSASSESALLHALEFLREKEDYQPDLIVFLQCTAPLTMPCDIDGTVQALLDQDADCALAVTPFHYFLWRRDEHGLATGVNHDARVRLLRQDRAPQFLETGAVYVMRAEGFQRAKHRFFGKIAMHSMPPERCLEIDAPVELEVAEMLLRHRQREEKSGVLPETIAALVLDFDGVFTDNRVVVFQDGKEAVTCNRSDGLGLERLRKLGVPVLALSAEKNSVVQVRCDKLGVECIHGVEDKLETLRRWTQQRGMDGSRVVYLGNDINDVACMRAVGCGVAVSDAHPQAKAAARIILTASGGHGAIRELCDMMIQRAECSAV